MASNKQRGWQIDWAGRHGTAWGTANAWLTTTTSAALATFCTNKIGIHHDAIIGGIVAATLLGVATVLARAAVSHTRQHPVTVIYHTACWIGCGTWVTLAYTEPTWTIVGAVEYEAVLILGAVFAGALAWLADRSKPEEDPTKTSESAPDASPTQRALDKDAAAWETILEKAAGIHADVPAVEVWEKKAPDGRPTGRTVQAEVRQGYGSWKTVQTRTEDINNYLNPAAGCGIRRVSMGATRRSALIEVTDVNLLAEEQPYPEDYSPLSIHDPLPQMASADGTVNGPELRERCVLVVGERGSGKSNSAQVAGLGVARMTDALLCDADCTGNRLSRDLLGPFVEGKTSKPAVFWSATDAREVWLLLRAFQRAAIARNNGYGDLCVQANDDKVPISPKVRQLVLRGDEIAHMASTNCDDPGIVDPTHPRFRDLPTLHDLVKSIGNDQRAAGCSDMLFGLRATDDVVAQDIQAQHQCVGVLRATSLAEYRWAFGANPPCDPSDAPWPGCIQMRLHSLDDISPYHVWRLKPHQLRAGALAVAEYMPDPDEMLDDLTALAMNGRDQHGNPFDDLFPGELDCLDTRWRRYFDKFSITRPTNIPVSAPDPKPRTPATDEGEMTVNPESRPTQTMEEANAALSAAVEEVQKKIADAGMSVPSLEDDDDPIDPDAWAAVLASVEAPEMSWQDHARGAIARAGAAGIGPAKILEALSIHGVIIHRDTLNEWLRSEHQGGRLVKPKHGRWAIAPDSSQL